ncbi:hypothetical protein H0H81_005457 [Sphagnurus paluster]|uniref:Uncharacterized protein n=1 Tax=Sphagnurus paluster TaxID=117069 RepID=A0A9P7GKJ2_9AGAR|nr:hypothetical protein H0H81_005457 [Sphagnurus paluster]
MDSTTANTSNNSSTPSSEPKTAVRIMVPTRPLLNHPDDEYITDLRDEEGRPRYDSVTVLHDLSTYDMLPSGRIIAGSKRAARARDAPLPAKEVRMEDIMFGAEAGAGAFEGFGVIDTARRGGMQELAEVANLWHTMPELLPQALSLFFHFLDRDLTPLDPQSALQRTPTSDRAFMCMVGLSKAGNLLNDNDDHGEMIVRAWPGVFKWSAFLFAGRIQNPRAPPALQKANLDFVSATWYSLSRSTRGRQAMNATKGCVEIATKMWILEDRGNVPSVIDIPSATTALHSMIRDDTEASLKRVVAAAGGDLNNVVQLALSRLRSAVNGPDITDTKTTAYLDLIGHLSRGQDPPLRNAFMHANTLLLCTKAALSISKLLNSGGPPILVDSMVAAFGYLANFLQSTDGFSWIIQSLQAGLLVAWVDSTPHLHKVDQEDSDMVLSIVRDILPKYLVYRSVIDAVDLTMRVLNQPLHKERVMNSMASKVWTDFHGLALERLVVTMQAAAFKGKEGKLQSISKSDSQFFHHLFTRDARHHLPRLRRLALTEYPGTTKAALIICIDYTVLPPKYSIKPLADYEKDLPEMRGSPNTEARNDALIERARENPGKFTIIQSKIANGEGLQMVMTVVTGSFWDDSDNQWAIPGAIEDKTIDGEDEKYSGKTIDGVDMMMTRMILNDILKSHGEPAAF